jgi:protocatechuate 3,4-dioxygenase beta subunit
MKETQMANHDPRRRRLLGATALLLAAGLGGRVNAAARALTPRQGEGPFYPRETPLESDADLISVAGRAGRAQGEVTHVFGRVLDRTGRPLSGVQVEIWQCDAYGDYHHVGRQARDPNFQGYGRVRTGADGGYRFRTIKPVPYTGRTPHIHFALSGPDLPRFTTQMYLAGEPRNAGDFLYRAIRDPAAREAVTVALNPAPELEAGALAGRFDIVLGRTAGDPA